MLQPLQIVLTTDIENLFAPEIMAAVLQSALAYQIHSPLAGRCTGMLRHATGTLRSRRGDMIIIALSSTSYRAPGPVRKVSGWKYRCLDSRRLTTSIGSPHLPGQMAASAAAGQYTLILSKDTLQQISSEKPVSGGKAAFLRSWRIACDDMPLPR